jgi:hypothetical protein
MLRYDAIGQSPDNIYCNIQVVNKKEEPTQFNYSDKKAFNIVESGYDYKLAVVRFAIDTSEIPIMYFPSTQFSEFALNSTYSTPDNNNYSITIVDNLGAVYQSYLQFESFNTSDPNDLRIWSVDQFVQILNKAIVTACLNTNVNDNKIPYFIYDESRAIIDGYFPEEFSNLADLHTFFMNKKLWRMFENFSHTVVNLNQGRDYKIEVFPSGNNTTQIIHTRNAVINPSTGATCLIVRGSYVTIYKLFQVRNLIFTTQALPIRSEFLNTSFDFFSSTSFTSQKILKNFEFSLEGTNALYTRGLQNFTVSEYEFIDLENSREINTIDLQIYYSDIHGKTFPLFVPPDSLTTVKLLFKRM